MPLSCLSRRLCTTRATAVADDGVNQNPCYYAVLNSLFLSVYLHLPDSWNVGGNNAVNCKDYIILVFSALYTLS
jgi:hypothetical protein